MPVDDLDAAKKNRERVAAMQAAERRTAPLDKWKTPNFNSNNPVRYTPPDPPQPPPALVVTIPSVQVLPKAQRHGIAHPVHYAKVKEVLPQVDKALASGASIRQCSRELGVAINTIREHTKEAAIDVSQQKTEPHWLLFALKGLAITSGTMTPEQVYENSMTLLDKFLKGNAKRTILELIPEVEHGVTFTADDLIRKTMEYVTKTYMGKD